MGDDGILLSIVVLDVKDHYLIRVTLDTIFHQTDKRYEILILTQNIPSQELHSLRRMSKDLSIVEVDPGVKISCIKNIALEKVKGKYVHFLFPGEYYLSKFSLGYVFENIIKEKFPDIICFSYLQRDITTFPQIFYPSFSKSFLSEKYYPLISRNMFFSKDMIMAEGGFDTRYKGLQGFDLITRILLKKKYRFVGLKRVIVDYELQKDDPQKVVGYMSDLIMIIYRYHGFFALFKPSVFKELMYFGKCYIKGLKRFFVRGE